LSTDDQHEPEPVPTGPKFYTAMACYAAIALLAAFTLDGNFRLLVWIFMAVLAVRTYLHAVRKP
jgi:hypothetical protein